MQCQVNEPGDSVSDHHYFLTGFVPCTDGAHAASSRSGAVAARAVMGNALLTLCDEMNKLVAAQHLDMPSALLNSVGPCSIDFHRGEAGPQELQVARVEAEVLVIFCTAACSHRVAFHSQPHYQLGKCHTKACLFIQEQNIRGDQPKEQMAVAPR